MYPYIRESFVYQLQRGGTISLPAEIKKKKIEIALIMDTEKSYEENTTLGI